MDERATAKLAEIVDVRPSPPPTGLVARWYAVRRPPGGFADWCDPAAERLADALGGRADLAVVEAAVVAFAEARSSTEHTADDLAADLVALLRAAPPEAVRSWTELVAPLDLFARALAAWAAERVAMADAAGCTDPLTGLGSVGFLRTRLRELHGTCAAMGIAPPASFGGVVVQLEPDGVGAQRRLSARVATADALRERFRAGETLVAVNPTRLVAVMPSYALGCAVADVREVLAGLSELDGIGVGVASVAFRADASSTLGALVSQPAPAAAT